MIRAEGLEPPLTLSKSAVLPLHHTPMIMNFNMRLIA